MDIQKIAKYFQVDKSIVPLISELLIDFWELGSDIEAYIQKEKTEIKILENNVTCAAWLIQKNSINDVNSFSIMLTY